MSIRSVLVASGCVLALALAGCSTTISGSPQAALSASAVTAPDDAPGDLSLPTDAAENPIDPADLLEGLDGMTGPDGSPLDPSSLGELLGRLGGEDGLGGTAGLGDLGAALSPECLSIAGASMARGFLMLGPMMGQPLTESDVDEALASLKDVPPELQDSVATLRDAAENAVGASPAEASQLLSTPAVSDAMDTIAQYLDAHCSAQ